jgi:hypothetical protein
MRLGNICYRNTALDAKLENNTGPTRDVMKRRMPSSGMLSPLDLVRTDVSEELIASAIRVTRIVELATTLALTRTRSKLRRNSCESVANYC